ncbi:MAG: MFS transporter [Promethearchaeota archaeon]
MNDTGKGSITLEYEAPKSRHRWWKYASNSSSQFAFNIIGTPMSIYLYFFYEVVLGLNGAIIFSAMSLFTIYNAINDPLLSYLMDRNTRFTKKWGRRFPWMILGFFPWCISFYFIFATPAIDITTNPWPLFWYLIVMLSLQDTFLVFYGLNIGVVRPDIFRTEKERRNLVPWWIGMDIASTIVAMIIGPYLIGMGNTKSGFVFMAGVFTILALIFCIISLPGNWEDKIVKERYFSIDENKERMNFITSVKNGLKTRSVLIYIILLASWVITYNLLLESSVYLNTFILRGSPDDMMILLADLIIAVIISQPFWLKLLKKKGNKKTLIIGGLLTSAALFSLTFASTLIEFFIAMFILGVFMGSFWGLMYTTIQAIVVDDFGVKMKTSQKAIIFGVLGFIGTFFTTIDEGLIALVHNLTGFIPGQATYEDMVVAVTAAGGDINLVLFGIRLLAGVIPAIVLLTGVLIFWKFFPLTKEIVLENKAKLKELGI